MFMDEKKIRNVEMICSILMAILTSFILLVAILISGKISKQTLEDQRYAELYVYPNDKGDFLIFQNTGSRSLYLDNYTINGKEYLINGSLIPPTITGYYYISLNDFLNASKLNLQIFYKNGDGKKYQTNVIGISNGDSWNIQTKKQIPFD